MVAISQLGKCKHEDGKDCPFLAEDSSMHHEFSNQTFLNHQVRFPRAKFRAGII
jgi:hypothetical protein